MIGVLKGDDIGGVVLIEIGFGAVVGVGEDKFCKRYRLSVFVPLLTRIVGILVNIGSEVLNIGAG